jgi:hypothetical protein
LEKVLRRQVGADSVEIDTRASTAAYAHSKPVVIDFDVIEGAAYDAGYTLVSLTLQLDGELSVGHCEACGGDVDVLTVAETGQRLEAAGDAPHGVPLRIVGKVTEWADGHARISIESATAR